MNYVSTSFFLFLVIGIPLYLFSPKRLQPWILLFLNIMFYAASDIRFFWFLGGGAFISYVAALGIERCRNTGIRKGIMLFSVMVLAGLLLFTKFSNYVINVMNRFLGGEQISLLAVLVPLGISFYTLQMISYCIDVYRGKYPAERNLLVYMLYVSYFPTIVQGPITRYPDMAGQFRQVHRWEYRRVKFGFQLFAWGLFKKLVIADRAAIFVNEVFNNYTQHSGVIVLIGAVLYSVQLYTDFSGCVDMCRGISQIMGIELMQNFEQPYFAVSIKDFWRRWHISLSSWLKDYVYIPLGGNRKGKIRKYVNILITFTVSGIWHGVGIHFLVWGCLHGVYQILGACTKTVRDRVVKKCKVNTKAQSYRIGQQMLTFGLVTFAWIFFRAGSFRSAIAMIRSVFTHVLTLGSLFEIGLDTMDFYVLILAILLLVAVDIRKERKISIREWVEQQNLWMRWSLYLGLIFAVLIFGIYGSGYDSGTFIYMQF